MTAPNTPEPDHKSKYSPPRLKVILVTVPLALVLAYGIAHLMYERRNESERLRAAAAFSEWESTRRDFQAQSFPFSFSFDGDGPINITEDGIAIKGYDVVAYFRDEEPVEGSSDITVTYHDATFQFASEENKRLFLDDPEKYIPAYGGFCALGVANGYKDDMHPAAFDIVDGRLFFNLTPSIHDSWRRHSERLIARADDNWPDLRTAPGYGREDAR